jgi:hypothetical protein
MAVSDSVDPAGWLAEQIGRVSRSCSGGWSRLVATGVNADGHREILGVEVTSA